MGQSKSHNENHSAKPPSQMKKETLRDVVVDSNSAPLLMQPVRIEGRKLRALDTEHQLLKHHTNIRDIVMGNVKAPAEK